jgi:hypothetical protein
MPVRTKLFKQLPWKGGVNNSLDESVIQPNQLTVADNVVFGTNGARRKREGINFNFDTETATSIQLIAGKDIFYEATGVKTQRQLVIAEDNLGTNQFIASYNGSTRTVLAINETTWSGTIASAAIEIIGNLAVFCASGNQVMKKQSALAATTVSVADDGLFDLDGSPPNASVMRTHQGRLWTNDVTDPDALHYCTVGNAEEWGGVGDSGRLDIGTGDGDPGGITAIFPTFKGILFVAKQTKLYKISGFTPATYKIDKVSDSLGCVSHNSIAAVDQDDIIFISKRGVHSLLATDKFGDFEAAFLSREIQKGFNEDWTSSRLENTSGAYLSSLNSVAFAVTDSSLDGATENNAIWLYHTTSQGWYRWPDIAAANIFLANDSDEQRWYIGGNNEKLYKTQIGNVNDTNNAGTTAAIPYTITTGLIFVENEPYVQVGFKRVILYYQKEGNHTITMNVTIDNFPTQSVTFSQSQTSDLLGSTFILGTSSWGSAPVMAAHSMSIDGYGSGIKVEITSTGETTADIEIQGIGIEYETAGIEKEQIET